MSTTQKRRTQPGEGWVRDRTSTSTSRNPSIYSSPLERFLSTHESVTGYRAIRTAGGARFACAVCGTKSLKGAGAEGANGTALIHFFCGHTVQENLTAIGMVMGDLFVKRDLKTMTPTERSRLRQAAMIPRWRSAMEVLSHEAAVLLIAANQLADNRPLNDADLTRVRVACLRVFDAQEVLHAH